MYPDIQAEQFSLAKIERLLGSNELPVYDLGDTRHSGKALPAVIEYAVLAVIVAAGVGFWIAVFWLIAG